MTIDTMAQDARQGHGWARLRNLATSCLLLWTGAALALTSTTTALTSSVNPSYVGQSSTLTATVTPSAATGTVTFKDGTTTLGTGTIASGTATLSKSFTTTGSHSLSAVYAGNTTYATSTSAAKAQTVNAKVASTTVLTSSVNPTIIGQASTLTATVSGTSPSGSVTFKDGATTLGTGTLSSGVASWAGSFATAGAHSLTAVYAGDTANNTSTSSALSQTVDPTPAALPSPPSSPAPVVNYEYDAQGNPTKTVQAPGVSGFDLTTQASYDTLNRTANTTDAKAGLTQFGYNGREDLTQVTDPRSLVTQYPRNGLGDVTGLVSPDTGTATQTVDAAGNLLTRTDSRGVLATYSYDALNRQSGVVYTQSGQTTLSFGWTYDQTGTGFSNGIGRLTSTTHPWGSTQYTYDPQGRLLTDIQRVAAATGANTAQITTTVGYGYDAAGHVTSITYPSGRKLTVTYTGGQPSAIGLAKDGTSAATALISQLQFSPFGPALSWQWQFSSGAQAHGRVYDSSGRLVRYPLGRFMRDVSYDAAERITAYTHYEIATGTATAAASALNQSFGYDELGRLTTVTAATSSWTIGYDANGNRTSVTLNGTQRAYTTATTSNRLASITNPARSFGYDNAGNTTSDSTSYTSTYNLAGRLATLTKGGVTGTYAYDGMGRRVRKFTSAGASSTVIFVYDQQGQLLGEYDSTGKAIREYVWLGSTPIAVFTPDTIATNPPLVYFIHADHLDTPRVVVDKNNAVRWRWMAEPFGTTAPETNPQALGVFTQPLRFPGQYADSETGLSYNFFRDFDSSTGRYVQSDPIGLAGGVNTYTYVEGNPLSWTDPQGLFVDSVTNACRTNPALCAEINGPLRVPPIAPILPPSTAPQPSPGPTVAPASPANAPVNKPALPSACPDNDCPPCQPYAKGTIGYIGPHTDHDHYPIGRPHLNLWAVNQNPSCKCFWNKANPDAAAPPALPGWVDLNRGFPPLHP
jgi:RHS repeat-associated protein